MSRKPSEASRRTLARFLSDAGLSAKDLEELLAAGSASRITLPKSGQSVDDFVVSLRLLADRGRLTEELLKQLETMIGGRSDDLNRIRVDMDFVPPQKPLVKADALRRVKDAARRSRIAEKLDEVQQQLPAAFRECAATSIDAGEQLDCWFDAANRQVLELGDVPWLLTLLHEISERALEPFKTDLTHWHGIVSAGDPPWELADPPAAVISSPVTPIAVLPGSPTTAPSVATPPPVTGRSPIGFALVVGVSKYANKREPDSPGALPPFTDLKYARKDAEDFSALLEAHTDIDFKTRVRCVVDEQATLPAIMQELDVLRQQCAQSKTHDPLAIVYFSGHGMRDRWDRHYLIPHDCNPDQLFATALWNRNLQNALEELPTRRLVVLLDACHAGAKPPDNSKLGALLQYDAKAGLDLQSDKGRYFIASCSAGEWSYEITANGIFTKHLLELFRCEGIETSELDLGDLYALLKQKVAETARTECKGASQSPTANIADRQMTGVILAINRRDRDRLARFRDAVLTELNQVQTTQRATITLRLRRFVDNDERAVDVDPSFYDLFREASLVWKGQADVVKARQAAADLAFAIERGTGPLAIPAGVTESRDANRSRLDVAATAEPLPSFAPHAPAVAPTTRIDITSAVVPVSSDARRRFSDEECDLILAAFPPEPLYFNGPGFLSPHLKQGLTRAKFTELLKATEVNIGKLVSRRAETAATDDERETFLSTETNRLADVLIEIALEFDKRWDKATPVAVTTTINLRAGLRD